MLPMIKRLRDWMKENKTMREGWAATVGDAVSFIISKFEKWLGLLLSGQFEKAIEQMTAGVVAAIKLAFDLLFEYVLPQGLKIGIALGDGIWKGLSESMSQTQAAKWFDKSMLKWMFKPISDQPYTMPGGRQFRNKGFLGGVEEVPIRDHLQQSVGNI